GVHAGLDGGGGVGESGRGGGDKPEVVEERAAVCRMEGVVTQGEFLGEFAQRKVGAVKIAHGQAGGVAPGGEHIHFAIVDLILLVLEGVNKVAGFFTGFDVLSEVEGAVGQVLRDAGVGAFVFQAGVHGGGKGLVRFA